MRSSPRTVLVVPDCHVPFHDREAWNLVLKVLRKERPDLVIQVGDFGDQHAASRHKPRPGEPKITLKEERTACRHEWRRLEDAAREVWFLEGNHDIRLHARAMEDLPGYAEILPDIGEFYGMSDAVRVVPYQDLAHVGKVAFTHDIGKSGGNATRDGLTAAQHCLVTGHTHRLEIVYSGSIFAERHFSMTVGWLGDVNSAAFRYAAPTTRRTWQLGFGWIRFIDGIAYATPVPIVNGACCVEGRRYV